MRNTHKIYKLYKREKKSLVETVVMTIVSLINMALNLDTDYSVSRFIYIPCTCRFVLFLQGCSKTLEYNQNVGTKWLVYYSTHFEVIKLANLKTWFYGDTLFSYFIDDFEPWPLKT